MSVWETWERSEIQMRKVKDWKGVTTFTTFDSKDSLRFFRGTPLVAYITGFKVNGECEEVQQVHLSLDDVKRLRIWAIKVVDAAERK